MSIKDWPVNERPREKLLANGVHSLSDAELRAVLLGILGRRGLDAVALACGLRSRHQSLRGLRSAQRNPGLPPAGPPGPSGAPGTPDPAGITATAGNLGLGPAGYCRLQAAVELARRHYAEAMRAGPPLDSPQATRDFLIRRLRDTPHELFCCLHLDNRHRLIGFDELFRGAIDGARLHPREVVKLTLARNAAAVILAHNHPLCGGASVTTGCGVTRMGARAGVDAGQHG
jgi:DNA repair protein RadC